MVSTSRRITALKDDSGISLVEAAVAIIVLGIVLVGLFPLVVDSIRLAAQNAEVAEANRIVATQLDRDRSVLAATACSAESAKPIVLGAAETTKFKASRTVACVGKLATVTIDVRRLATPTVIAATATTKVLTK